MHKASGVEGGLDHGLGFHHKRGTSTRGNWHHAWLGIIALLWILLSWVLWYARPAPSFVFILLCIAACATATLPGWLRTRRRFQELRREVGAAQEQAARLKLELDTVHYRTARLREELAAADSQARHSHQLMLLGRFTAGFLHEFNNPLAILTSRIEVLLDERREDAGLCSDLNQMLKEARYMAKISSTLLPALRRERGAQTFSPCAPAEVLRGILASLAASAQGRGVQLILEAAEVPPVNLPEHVLEECLRVLVSNALDALSGMANACIWIRIEPYHNPGSPVFVQVEDNGPGVPQELRERLFEPFTSRGTGRERLGLGLFVAASLLDIYDSSVKYEPRPDGGARFTLALPPSRFTKEQPYHWFVQAAPV